MPTYITRIHSMTKIKEVTPFRWMVGVKVKMPFMVDNREVVGAGFCILVEETNSIILPYKSIINQSQYMGSDVPQEDRNFKRIDLKFAYMHITPVDEKTCEVVCTFNVDPKVPLIPWFVLNKIMKEASYYIMLEFKKKLESLDKESLLKKINEKKEFYSIVFNRLKVLQKYNPKLFEEKQIAVHPVVLLSVVDHYYRLAKETTRRVIGVLLGEVTADRVDITSCYALPFEEDPKDKKVWFVDHVYNETMFEMQQKINYKEVIVGWYSSGPKIRPHDIEINEVFRKYCTNPIFVVIDVQEKETLGVPTEAFIMKEEVDIDGTLIKTFIKLPTTIEASLPEQIGVEFLLRDITESSRTSQTKIVNEKVTSLKALIQRLTEIKNYLNNVISKKIVANPLIINNIQEIFNYLPNFDTDDIIKSLSTQTNNNYLMLYLASLMRTTTSLHKIINNKLMLREEEKNVEKNKEDEKKKEEEKKKKEENKETNAAKENETKK